MLRPLHSRAERGRRATADDRNAIPDLKLTPIHFERSTGPLKLGPCVFKFDQSYHEFFDRQRGHGATPQPLHLPNTQTERFCTSPARREIHLLLPAPERLTPIERIRDMTTDAGTQHDEVQASYDWIGRQEPAPDLSLLLMFVGVSLVLWFGVALITPDWFAAYLFKLGIVFTLGGTALYIKDLWMRR